MTGLAALTGVGALALPALAEEAAAPAVTLGAAPTTFELSHEYYKDAAQVVNHMKYVVIVFLSFSSICVAFLPRHASLKRPLVPTNTTQHNTGTPPS